VTAWLIAKAIPWLLGFMALFGLYQRGVHNGKVKAHRDTLEAYEKQRKAIDNADLGTGASDADRIKRLHEFAEKP